MKTCTYIANRVLGPHNGSAESTHDKLRDAVDACASFGTWAVIRIGPDSAPWAGDGLRTVAASSDPESREYAQQMCARINAHTHRKVAP